MRKKRKYKFLIILLLFISIGFAVTLLERNVFSTFSFSRFNWNIYLSNVQVVSGSTASTSAPTIDGMSLNCATSFTELGDYYEFTVDVVNNGEPNAVLESINAYEVVSGTDQALPNAISFEVKHSDDTAYTIGETINKGSSRKYKIRLTYNFNIQNEDLITTATTKNIKVELKFKMDDPTKATSGKSSSIICKRATTLHTTTCTASSNNEYYACRGIGYSSGATMTFGSLGTSGTLTAGDAFDCDVNGDGTYDAARERFYYVSRTYNTTTKSFDNNYAALIYYSNYNTTAPNNTVSTSYSSELTSGPMTAFSKLPDSTIWSNLGRTGYNNNKTIILDTTESSSYNTLFTYPGKNSRFLRHQELMSAMGKSKTNKIVSSTGDLKDYIFLLENTKNTNDSYLYGYYMETLYNRYGSLKELIINGYSSCEDDFTYSSGARPVIDVKLTDMQY